MMNCKLCASSENVLTKKVISSYKMRGSSIKSGFSIFRCLNCDIMWPEPVLEQDILLECYDREYYETYAKNADYKKKYFGSRLNELEFYVSKGRVLDIGCGWGEELCTIVFLEFWPKRYFARPKRRRMRMIKKSQPYRLFGRKPVPKTVAPSWTGWTLFCSCNSAAR